MKHFKLVVALLLLSLAGSVFIVAVAAPTVVPMLFSGFFQPTGANLALSSNMTGSVNLGDTVRLFATLSPEGLRDRPIAFYANGVELGTNRTVGGVATWDYFVDGSVSVLTFAATERR